VSGSYAMYAWSNGDTSSTVLVGGTGTSTGTVEYVLTATDANGCSDEDTIEVKFKNCIPQGLTEVELGIQTTVYPNPTTGVTQIKIVGSSQSELGISLVDLTGRRVQNVYQGATPGILQFEVDFTRITSGMYFLLTNNGAAVESIPIIIE
ncbi:MAG: T9SS type A sorting domain-containing protein, partial [Flavobacteriales bacterium]|nr:T9SS type A sorting domain-containing protein [Flavobacteriales bacterium]